jgi:periplasmic protein TonB
MASTEDVARTLPETLPEDFGDWDSEGAQAPLPAGSDEWKTSYSQNQSQKSHGQPDYLDSILQSFDNKPRVWRSDPSAAVFVKPPAIVKPQDEFGKWQSEAAKRLREEDPSAGDASDSREAPQASAEREALTVQLLDVGSDPWPELSEPVFAKPQKTTVEGTNGSAGHTAHRPEASHTADEELSATSRSSTAVLDETPELPELSTASMRESDHSLFEIFSAKNLEAEEENPARRRWAIVGAAGGAALLLPLILIFSMSHHGAKAVSKQSVQPPAAAADSQPTADAPESQVSEAASPGNPPAPAQRQQNAGNPTAHAADQAASAPPMTEAQLEMMNDQLEAPRMIPKDAKAQVAETAPPSASLGADGLGGGRAGDGVLKVQAHPIVTAAEPLAISSGVATGMLIQQTPLVYPSIAKTAGVSGTVELHAIISKAGTVTELRVVSGPAMLQQAAVDAVRSWRYRPYKLNNEPVDVETTISVIFTLGH